MHIESSEQATAHCTGMLLRIAVDYSAQDSLIEVCRRVRSGRRLSIARRFVERLAEVDHATLPAPEVDLLIRTGGEKRLSDFLLWECAYAELYFVDCLWPDFDERAFDAGAGRIRAPRSALRRHRRSAASRGFSHG